MNKEELKKKIKDAAIRDKAKQHTYDKDSDRVAGFVAGALSSEAAEFHTHALRIEMVAKCAKLQVELKDSLYTKEEVEEFIKNAYSYGYIDRDKDIGFGSNVPYALEQLKKEQ